MAVKASAEITLTYLIDIKATYRYYCLQSSTLAAPSKPTTNPPASPWTDSEPTYTSGSTSSLYYVDLTVFSNDTFLYSSVSLSTSYEAAKEAYNKAQNAQDTANSAQESVDNMEIGGRNLMAGTSLDTVYSGNNGGSGTKDVWAAKTIDIPTETEYIVSFDAKADVAQDISCFFYNPNTTLTSESSTGQKRNPSIDGHAYVSITTEWKRYWVKWTQTAADAVKSVIVGRCYTADTIYIRAVKLEKGNKATDWTPAPEDVDSGISDAAKVAINFMQHDSTNGLLIGDKTSGSWSGYRTQVKSDSFNVLDADGNTLSTFGANKIDLGNNSEDTEISMCNGLGRIYVDARPDDPTYSSVHVSSDNLTLRGDNVLMYAYNEEQFDEPQDAGSPLDGLQVYRIQRVGTVKVQPDSFVLASAKGLWDGPSQYWGSIETEIRGETGQLTLYANEGIKLNGTLVGDIRPEEVSVSTAGTTDTLLQGVFDAMGNGTFKTIRLAQSVQDSLPVAGSWFVTIYKTSATYGVVTAIRYYAATSPSIVEYRRSIYAGTWSPWEQVGLPTETGTWTATTNGGSITAQKCTYMKVGNMCTISFFIQGVGGTGTANTNFYFSGAPFTPASGATWYGGGGHVQGLYDTSGYPVTGCIIQSGRVYFRTSKAGAADTGYIRVNNGGAAYYLSGTITYPIA